MISGKLFIFSSEINQFCKKNYLFYFYLKKLRKDVSPESTTDNNTDLDLGKETIKEPESENCIDTV